MARSLRSSRRRGLAGLALAAGAFVLLHPDVSDFVRGSWDRTRMANPQSMTHLAFDGMPATLTMPGSSEHPSVDDATVAASVVGGVLGAVVGGLWLGGALFALTSYLARGDDEVAEALQDAGEKAIDAVVYAGYVNGQYRFTEAAAKTANDALGSVVQSAKANPVAEQAAAALAGLLIGAGDVVRSFDRDVGINSALATITSTSSELASQMVASALEFAEERGVTDHIKEVLQDLTKRD